ncbi:hypothetical protein RD110_08800 [Rhodoferax koreense]|uniref:Nitrogen fixation protein FixH n=1 Tax=Rhodoferax koreensis TaxID=1842727 RepID=A0A1P8JU34_9BURK|nr:FixH family protein [Rhodoferax koreense]APW37279.1 hypothetical protein RD110_08800 [Rhodoferax koreense]
MSNNNAALDPRPWYRFPLVWMVISGPACVVVAGFATLWIAIAMPDPVIADDASRQAAETIQSHQAAADRLTPALVGRNHAATPGADLPVPGVKKP